MPNYGVVVSATGCGEDIDDDGNPITINAVAVYGISAVDTACPPACLPAFLPPSPPPPFAPLLSHPRRGGGERRGDGGRMRMKRRTPDEE